MTSFWLGSGFPFNLSQTFFQKSEGVKVAQPLKVVKQTVNCENYDPPGGRSVTKKSVFLLRVPWRSLHRMPRIKWPIYSNFI